MAPSEPLSNWRSKAIYPSSPIRANNVSLDKGQDHEFTSAGIMTRRASGLGRCQVKRGSFRRRIFLRHQSQLKSSRHISRRQKCNRSASSGENNARMNLLGSIMHPFHTRMVTRTKIPILFLRIEIRGEWQIWSTRINTSNPRHTIRYQMTNVPLTPARKSLTYWKR